MFARYFLAVLSLTLSTAWLAHASERRQPYCAEATKIVLDHAEIRHSLDQNQVLSVDWSWIDESNCNWEIARTLEAHGLKAEPMNKPKSAANLCAELQQGRTVVALVSNRQAVYVFVIDEANETCSKVRLMAPGMKNHTSKSLSDWYEEWRWESGMIVAP